MTDGERKMSPQLHPKQVLVMAILTTILLTTQSHIAHSVATLTRHTPIPMIIQLKAATTSWMTTATNLTNPRPQATPAIWTKLQDIQGALDFLEPQDIPEAHGFRERQGSLEDQDIQSSRSHRL